MPTYDYKCPKCEHLQEDFHSMSQEPKVKCEKCKTVMEKQVTSCGIVFKGTGFYTTDYLHTSERNKDAQNTIRKIQQGDQRVVEDMVGEAKKVKAENRKQNSKNMPVRRRSS